MKDIHGKAILEYFKTGKESGLTLHNSYDVPEEMPVSVFFRDELDLSVLEHLALIECQGTVLDVGAGAGALSLILQDRDFDVYALENSPGCVQVMNELGLRNILTGDFYSHNTKYDTLLIQMNGLGMAGTLDNIPPFLGKCMSLLKQEGQLLIDSSDISYLYEDGLTKPKGYFGEVQYQYEYQDQKGDWFDWVYLDQGKLKELTDQIDLKLEILAEENDQYLARITA